MPLVGLKHYLRSMKEMNLNMSPQGLARLSRTLMATDVPLDDVFIPLHVIPDCPIFDIPTEQQRQPNKMQQRTDLSDREREDYLYRLLFIKINDYAERLAKEPITLKQFLIIQLSEIHPYAAANVL